MSSSSSKKAIVFGSSSDIGRSICEFLSSDFIVTPFSRRNVNSDFNYDCSIEHLSDTLLRRIASNDVFVFNQAFTSLASYDSVSDDEMFSSFQVNLFFPINIIKSVLKFSTSPKRFIFITSIAGSFRSETASVIYSCSKRSLHGLIKHFSKELASHCDFVGLAPSQVLSGSLMSNLSEERIEQLKNQHPTNQLCTPKEISYMVKSIALYPGRHINGSIIDLNGGLF